MSCSGRTISNEISPIEYARFDVLATKLQGLTYDMRGLSIEIDYKQLEEKVARFFGFDRTVNQMTPVPRKFLSRHGMVIVVGVPIKDERMAVVHECPPETSDGRIFVLPDSTPPKIVHLTSRGKPIFVDWLFELAMPFWDDNDGWKWANEAEERMPQALEASFFLIDKLHGEPTYEEWMAGGLLKTTIHRRIGY